MAENMQNGKFLHQYLGNLKTFKHLVLPHPSQKSSFLLFLLFKMQLFPDFQQFPFTVFSCSFPCEPKSCFNRVAFRQCAQVFENLEV